MFIGKCLWRFEFGATLIFFFFFLFSYCKSVWSFFRDIGKIDDLMDDINEQQDLAKEISDAISRPSGEMFDEVHKLFISLIFFVLCLFKAKGGSKV